MSEEKLKVLEMLKENQISTEEALNLLQALGEDENRQDGRRHRENGRGPGYSYDYDYGHDHRDPRQYRGGHSHGQPWINPVWLDDLRENIMESAKNVADFVQNQDFMFDRQGGPSLTYMETFENLPQQIKSIKIAGKNDQVSVTAHDDNNITIEARYRPKFGMNPNVSFEEENGRYTLYYDANALRSMGINLKVPKGALGDLYVESKNAALNLSNLEFDTGDFVTKNANLRAYYLKGSQIHLETKNAGVEGEGLTAKDLDLSTANAKIILQNSGAESIRMSTSNAPIQCDNIDAQQILAKTSHAPIKLRLGHEAVVTNHNQYTIDASTTDANITVDTPFPRDTPVKIKASTTWGNVRTNFAGLEGGPRDKNYIDAKSPDYENANKKLGAVLQTSNGSVTINAKG